MNMHLKASQSFAKNMRAEDENKRLHERTALLEAVIDNFPGGVVLTDRQLNVLVCNKQLRSLLQYPESLFANDQLTLEDLFRFNARRGEYGPGDAEEIVKSKMELALKAEAHAFERVRPNGQVLEIRGTPLPAGGFVTSYVDVTENRKTQAEIVKHAFRDQLTGLANRSIFLERMTQALALARRDEQFALHYIDLDDFKPVNDRFGHDAGDHVLKEIANRFKSTARETDLVARMGGDEFAVIQTKVPSVAMAEKFAKRLLVSARQPIMFGQDELRVGASIGIAISTTSAEEAAHIVKQADLALYESKRRGKNRFRIFGSEPRIDPGS
jgi:diguanylate cyclase (GGDEF)-like protein